MFYCSRASLSQKAHNLVTDSNKSFSVSREPWERPKWVRTSLHVSSPLAYLRLRAVYKYHTPYASTLQYSTLFSILEELSQSRAMFALCLLFPLNSRTNITMFGVVLALQINTPKCALRRLMALFLRSGFYSVACKRLAYSVTPFFYILENVPPLSLMLVFRLCSYKTWSRSWHVRNTYWPPK
jgi:hypothetical protein